MITVSTTAGLIAALKAAATGAVIGLMPGNYAPTIKYFHGSATIMSALLTTPAKITSLDLQYSSGLTFSLIDFDASNFPPSGYGAPNTNAFKITASNHITLVNLNVHGSPLGTLQTDVSGFLIRDGSNIVVANSDFHNLHHGLGHLNLDGLIVRNNRFHNLRDDGVRGGGSSNVLIQSNSCYSNHPDGPMDTDHPDCIQFWTSNTTVIAHDITITGNNYNVGTGYPTQGIFVRDELGNLPLNRVTISNNTISGAGYNPISVSGATNVKVSGNNVCNSKISPEWIIIRNVSSILMLNNKSPLYEYINVNQLTESGNVLNQNRC